MFFYRHDGLIRYYDIHPDGTIGALITPAATIPQTGVR